MITVTLQQILGAASTLPQLAALPMTAKTKYWIGRIMEKVNNAQRDFEKTRLGLIKDLGEAVEFVKNAPIEGEGGVKLDNPGGQWLPITDPEKLKQPNLQYMVKAENQEAFDKNMNDLFSQNIVIPFSAISIDDLKTARGEPVEIPFDLSPVLWMFSETTDEED